MLLEWAGFLAGSPCWDCLLAAQSSAPAGQAHWQITVLLSAGRKRYDHRYNTGTMMHCAATDAEKHLSSTATEQVSDCASLTSRCVKDALVILLLPNFLMTVIDSSASVNAPAEDRHCACTYSPYLLP